jgi:hypothetical protein
MHETGAAGPGEQVYDAVRAKLAALDLTEKDVAKAVASARTPGRNTRK